MENRIVQLLVSLLNTDRRRTAPELAAEIGVCHKTVLHILHILGYRKLPARWIPHEISEVQQWHCYAQALLVRYQREGEDFIGQNVAKDETRVRSYEPNLKHQSNKWKHPGSPRPKKLRWGPEFASLSLVSFK